MNGKLKEKTQKFPKFNSKQLKDGRIAIVGLSLAIFFFTSVLFMGDSIDASLTEYLTSSNDVDIDIYSPSMFFNSDLMVDSLSSSISEFSRSFSRIKMDFLKKNGDSNFDSATMLAVDFSGEHNQNFGFNEESLLFRSENWTQSIFQGLSSDNCIISDRYSEQNQVSIGTVLEITFPQLNFTHSLFVVGIFEKDENAGLGKNPNFELIVNLPTFWDLLNTKIPLSNGISWNHKVNTMLIDLVPETDLYTFGTMEETNDFLQNQGAQIIVAAQNYMPSLQDLTLEYKQLANARNSKTFQLLVTALTFFMGLSAVFLSTTFIYSTLTTSLNDRIREFGIERTIGASKDHILKKITFQGFKLGIVGSLIGSLASVLFFLILSPLLQKFDLTSIRIRPLNVFYGCSLGIIISTLVSFVPARYAYNMPLIRSIYPDRFIESKISFKTNGKKTLLYLTFVGFVLCLVGLFVFMSLPNIMISGKIDFFLNLMSITLFCVMIGFILLGLGILPLLIRGFLAVFSPVLSNIRNFLKMSIFRHNRRNNLINFMLLFSFCMIIFTSSFMTNVTNQMILQKQLKTGSDMFIHSSDQTLLPMDLRDKVREVEGVESSTAVLRTGDLQNHNFPGNPHVYQDLSLSISEIGGVISTNVFSVAVDQDFARTIYQDIIRMDMGTFEGAFEQLFSHTSVIIFAKLAATLEITINDSLRLKFKNNNTIQEEIVNVAGIFTQIPGVRSFEEFTNLDKQSFDYLNENGILFSRSLFNQGFGMTSDTGNQGYASRILVKVSANADEDLVRSDIYTLLTNYNLEIITTTQWIFQDQKLFSNIKYGVSILLFIFIFTAVSNLSVSAYSIFVERQNEIRALRGIGLSIKDIEKVFSVELLILLFANGIVGVLGGSFMAYTFSSLGEVAYRVQTPFSLSFDLIIALFIISGLYLKFTYHRIFRQKIETKIAPNLTI
ncbi:hypothetical protein NEF87_001665 [Candidatus Lokiarchaeum ossiferum]|uniref:ABC3 transporter permease C-terminal domain-containing protein n=1 Tax=Candidatus Lokiarchaeum ossiferum TaxID=2951803 RepID=A0ABY6HPP3_9ARCH|nr:hypothetical protein NEF87_001665 [Candidatus Lokiarchaeum sp. B-35]